MGGIKYMKTFRVRLREREGGVREREREGERERERERYGDLELKRSEVHVGRFGGRGRLYGT
jgi:hypothetical protein